MVMKAREQFAAHVTSDSSHRLHIAGPVAIGWAAKRGIRRR